MSKDVFLFSGLGVDQRVFKTLDLSDYNVHPVDWIRPEKNETLENYAMRLSDRIQVPDPVLIGLSFGGMLAVEIAKQKPVKKAILISSAKSRGELPFYYRWGGNLGLHRCLKTGMVKHGIASFAAGWLFGTTSKKEEELLKEIITDTDPWFFKWAMNGIVKWRSNGNVPENVFHIHGTKDHVLPFKYVSCNYAVKNGGHLMILNKAAEISDIIRSQLSN